MHRRRRFPAGGERDEDLDRIENQGGHMKKQYTNAELTQAYTLRNRGLSIEDRLTMQEIADEVGLTLMQVCDMQARLAEIDAPHTPAEADAKG
jgi:hypothetical protein